MQTILKAMEMSCITLFDKSNNEAMVHILRLTENDAFTQQVADYISQLWTDSGVKQCYNKRELYWLLDSAAYYFDEVQRFAQPNYKPTEMDLIMARVRTTGIDTAEFHEPPHCFQVVDVGGQRNERRKWIHCFENVSTIVFLVGLNEYNQRLFEDIQSNRMQESLDLFRKVVSNHLFCKIPVFLLLNKRDLFENSVQRSSIRKCFPEFEGPDNDVAAALAFIEKQFSNIAKECSPEKELIVKIISATERADVEDSWEEITRSLKFGGEKLIADDFRERSNDYSSNDHTISTL